ncbi:hypothetical protein I7I51_05951 [Histoplasma capsulatum]|uniref:Uncharacterized protein n=1 Tax=Ajellomyces capsulatus TaxID=5037 RepID=A0A8A1MJ07_AJECA|nr:hypothetical protein I7I51_05951 [Histoplasma capsulatum]
MSRLGISSSMRLENRRLDGGFSCRPQSCQLALVLAPRVQGLRRIQLTLVKSWSQDSQSHGDRNERYAIRITNPCQTGPRAISVSSASRAQNTSTGASAGAQTGAGWLAGELPSVDDASSPSSMAIHVSIPIVWCWQA